MSHLHGFRRRNAAALYEAHHGPNMTPMVDVVMVILIFFMTSAAILGPEWFVPTRLPKAGGVQQGSPQAQAMKLHLRVETLGQDAASPAVAFVRINNSEPVSLDALDAALRAAIGDRPASDVLVLIDPSEQASYEDVVRVHAACARVGLVKVGLGSISEMRTGSPE